MTNLTAKQVADFLVHFALEHGDTLTNLKLQKLLYYAQAWHLALYDKELFAEKFQAWVHGPVIPELYSAYKKYGSAPILDDPGEIDLPEKVRQHLIEVYEVFGSCSAWELERMTHMESPWINARQGLSPDANSSNVISEVDMKEFYRKLKDGAA